MTTGDDVTLDLDDIQSGALRERPSPYVGRYLLLRLDDVAQGRELVRRLHALLEDQRSASPSATRAWLTVAFTYEGLKALGVPPSSLDSFPREFREGMAARAQELGDVGESGPERWEPPLGSPDVHVAVSVLAPDPPALEAVAERARSRYADLASVAVVWRQDCYQLPSGRTSFGFKDGIGNPDIEGSGLVPRNSRERPIKAGEFILGYPDETGSLAPMPIPDVLGRNGTYLVFRKLHTNVAAYRRYLRDRARDRQEERLLAAKMVGRWPSGAPLALAPDRDEPSLGADPHRNNDFAYGDDPGGFKCPAGAHSRRANPRDSLESELTTDTRLHRMVRRGTSYGPQLPDDVLDDDGADRGIIFVFAGAHLKRQFEFVKTQWLNDGIFIGAPAERDPLVGAHQQPTDFTMARRPIRRRLRDVPPFVVTRGGEYCFAPGLRALRWLGELDT
ncbi:Dyp-type peroxidase [Occultella glacieicola]|uniref:Dyp-type peroxidase n=1 Tax=Occultella glacieicola TaxID=2518684 RepID=A0ABY2E273_9MICO|nr:Dyp-type peroxidase [Occultella glacieicola]TDE92591.1 Dyp-type peroxidase [Occultella glacieicola]